MICRVIFYAVVGLSLFTVSCSTPNPIEKTADGVIYHLDRLPEQEKKVAVKRVSEQLFVGLRNYKLLPGDVIEIMFFIQPSMEDKIYRVHVGDKLSIKFRYHSDFSTDCVVRPDGRITLPFRGELSVAGKTPDQIARYIAHIYSNEFRDPVVSVIVQRYSSNAEIIEKTLSSSIQGMSLKLTIGSDGKINLPYIGTIDSAGKSVRELETIINELYSQRAKGVKTTVLLAEAKGQRIFVFGAVKKPGLFPVSGPTTIVQAIAMAGGLTTSGDIHKIGVLYWDSDLQPRIRTVSMSRIINNLQLDEDLILPPNSVIYVPFSPVAKVGLFIKQYIKDIFMFNGVSLGFSYELHSESDDNN